MIIQCLVNEYPITQWSFPSDFYHGLQNDFLIPSFLLHLLADILQDERFFLTLLLLPLLFSLSFSFWWQRVLTVLWILFKAVCCKWFLSLFFLILEISQIWPGRAPSSALFCPFLHNPPSPQTFLALRHNSILRYNLHFPCLRPGISHFSKKLWLLWVENGIKKPNTVATCGFIFGEIIPITNLISTQKIYQSKTQLFQGLVNVTILL